MIISNLASRLLRPFANAGAKATIPLSQTDATRASYEQGFPALNMTPIAAGGVPPSGQDFNGILYDLSNAVMWQQAAGILPWSAEFAQSPVSGGYPKNALVVHNAVLYQSSVDNNTETPGAGTNWQGVGVSNASQPQHAVTQKQMQDVLGNYAGQVGIVASRSLLASESGLIVNAQGTITVTLPVSSGLVAGLSYQINNQGSGVVTVVAGAGDNLYGIGNETPRSFVLGSGDSITVGYVGGTRWYAWGGLQLGASAGFGSSLAESGYQRLPSGLIIQWGGGTTNSAGNYQAALPIAFPTQQIRGLATTQGEANPALCISVFSLNTTAIDVRVRTLGGAAQTMLVSWIAIGY